MDDKGYAFSPLAFLLIIPVIILAVSYSSIVTEVNTLSAIIIGGDVTATIVNNVIKTINDDTADAGRKSAFLAVQSVINNYNLLPNNDPFFDNTGNNSTAFVLSATTDMLNTNITNTCRDLEKQTGREIYINNIYLDPDDTSDVTIFGTNDLTITQSDPFGFYIKVPSIPIKIIHNSSDTSQSVEVNTPTMNVYISIDKMEDPYIWVKSKARISSVINKYPYYTSGSVFNSTVSDYHFADKVSNGSLNYLWDCLVGPNSAQMGYRPYYFPDSHGLTFFDRLENRTFNNSLGPDSAKMSTFILNDPLQEDHGNQHTSAIDHEYFSNILGYNMTTTHGTSVNQVMGPDGRPFYISTNYISWLGFRSDRNYNY